MIKTIYNRTIRQHLPRKIAIYGSVPARDVRLFDRTDYFPDYKSGLKDAIDNHIEDGDRVLLVGGGRGVSSVWLANAGAEVIAYEAADVMSEIARETIETQGVGESVDIRRALVGAAIEVYGSADGAEVIGPADLPEADVLVMDCEGAETSILETDAELPETIIVETHPERGEPTDATRSLLTGRGYDISEYSGVHDRGKEKCILVGCSAEKRPNGNDARGDDGD